MSGVKRLVRYHRASLSEPFLVTRSTGIELKTDTEVACSGASRAASIRSLSSFSTPRMSKPAVKDRVAIDDLGA
jgi:hypothetical protein